MTETIQAVNEPPKAASPGSPGSIGALPGVTVGVFYGQLAGLLRAGMPMPRALQTLAHDSDSPAFRAALERTALALEQGESPETVFMREERDLGGVVGRVMAAAATTGKLPALLSELSSWTLNQAQIRRRIMDALLYPYSVLTLASLLSFGFLSYTQFFGINSVDMLKEMDLGGEGPAMRFLFPVLPLAVFQGIAGTILAGCLFLPVLDLLSRFNAGLRYNRETLLVRLPVVGAVCRPLALSRLCGCVSILMKAGRSYHDAVAAAGPLSGFAPYADAAQRAAEALKSGGSASDAWSNRRLFPETFRFILASAEQRGDTPEAFAQLAKLYEAEAEARGRVVATLAPPVFFVLIGLVVGVMILGILGPLLRVLEVMERIGK